MKRFLAAMMAAMMLLLLGGCQKAKFPTIEDSQPLARKESNHLAAAQGEWMVMRSEKKGAPCLILYNKKEKKGQLIAEGEYHSPGILDESVFYQAEETGDLYRLDLSTGESACILPSVEQYQVRDGLVYYLIHGNLYTYRLDYGTQMPLKTGYEVDDFWLTDFGVYYYTAKKQLLMVLPYGATDRIVCAVEGAVLDVASTQGAHIAFIQKGSKANSLCTYNPADRSAKNRMRGGFSTLLAKGEKIIFAEGAAIFALDLATDQKQDWGGQKAENVQLLPDCALFYNGNTSAIRHYPE
jgi:hypothetical protein